MVLDELDHKIIRILRENSLTPFVEIARQIRVSEGTIRYRIKKLQKNRVIRCFTIMVDPKVIGLEIVAFLILTVLPGHIWSVASTLAQLEKVIEVHEIHTFGNLLVKIRASNLDELRNIIADQVKTIQGIAGSHVISVLSIWKEDSIAQQK